MIKIQHKYEIHLIFMVLNNLVWEQINMLMQPPKNESRRELFNVQRHRQDVSHHGRFRLIKNIDMMIGINDRRKSIIKLHLIRF